LIIVEFVESDISYAPRLPLTGTAYMKQLTVNHDMNFTFPERLNVATESGTKKSPIILHAADALRRARKLPVGAARNDLRQLARELRELHRIGAYASLQNIESPAMGSELL
jgi:hypothetical protein